MLLEFPSSRVLRKLTAEQHRALASLLARNDWLRPLEPQSPGEEEALEILTRLERLIGAVWIDHQEDQEPDSRKYHREWLEANARRHSIEEILAHQAVLIGRRPRLVVFADHVELWSLAQRADPPRRFRASAMSAASAPLNRVK